jgi:hypothetical protein
MYSILASCIDAGFTLILSYMSTELLGKKQLLQALKDANLPCTYPTLLRFERLGIIEKPVSLVSYEDRAWRFYTVDELKIIIDKIREYKTNGNTAKG